MVWCAVKTVFNVHVGESMLNVHLSMNAVWGMYAKGINQKGENVGDKGRDGSFIGAIIFGAV